MTKRAFLTGEKHGFILLISFIIFFASIAVFFALSVVIAIPVFGLSFTEIVSKIQDPVNPENLPLIQYLQIFQSIGIFILPSVFIGFLISRQPVRYLDINKKLDVRLVIIVVLSILCASPFINLLSYINQQMELPSFLHGIENWMKEKEAVAEELTTVFLNIKTISGLLINILMIGILPAVGEEMTFRGIIQKQFVKMASNNHIGVFAAAFIFSAFHLQFYGFIPRLILGMYLGYLFVWTGNLWYPIIAHFTNNTMTVIAYYIINISNSKYDIDSLGITKDTILVGIISVVITFFLVRLIFKISPDHRQ